VAARRIGSRRRDRQISGHACLITSTGVALRLVRLKLLEALAMPAASCSRKFRRAGVDNCARNTCRCPGRRGKRVLGLDHSPRLVAEVDRSIKRLVGSWFGARFTSPPRRVPPPPDSSSRAARSSRVAGLTTKVVQAVRRARPPSGRSGILAQQGWRSRRRSRRAASGGTRSSSENGMWRHLESSVQEGKETAAASGRSILGACEEARSGGGLAAEEAAGDASGGVETLSYRRWINRSFATLGLVACDQQRTYHPTSLSRPRLLKGKQPCGSGSSRHRRRPTDFSWHF